jgi:photosystem II stability/assembly factor-like uncharacterized protein
MTQQSQSGGGLIMNVLGWNHVGRPCRFVPACTVAVVILVVQARTIRAQVMAGKSDRERQLNAALLEGYDLPQYTEAITGYTGQNRQRIGAMQYHPAVRVRVGPRGNYKAGMTRMPQGGLIIAACRKVRGVFTVCIYVSMDNGLTWAPVNSSTLHGKEPALIALKDGTLLMTVQGGVGPGSKPTEVPLSRSEDGGKTWTTTNLEGQDYPRNLIEEPDGTVLMIRARMPGWSLSLYEKEGRKVAGSPHLELLRSRDRGRTWERSEGRIPWDYTEFGEVASVRLADGRLLAALRAQVPGTRGEGFEHTLITESTDGGRTWSRPAVMTHNAEVHVYLTALADGRVLATYSNYHLPYGVYAVVSNDGGKTWNLDRPVELALSADIYVGWPVTLQLPEGELITCHALTTYVKQPPDTTTCEVVRWKMPP